MTSFQSTARIESKAQPGVVFWIRKVSLAQRISLLEQVGTIGIKDEFLRAGPLEDQVAATLNSVKAAELLIRWGLERIEGLTIDGAPATVELLVDRGPEEICGEVAEALQSSLGLNEDERKNS
jgi:hypothetical protein